MKVLIVGAGFGGLALAAYLLRDGHSVTLIEKKKDQEQEGFVIGLWSNGRHTRIITRSRANFLRGY